MFWAKPPFRDSCFLVHLLIFACCHLHLLPSVPLLVLLLHPPSHFLDSFPKHLVYHTLVRGSLCDLFSSKGDLISHSIFVFADMIRRRHLRTRSIKMFVLDESDEMLNKGIPYLRNPCRHCNSHFYIHICVFQNYDETFYVDWSTFCFTS